MKHQPITILGGGIAGLATAIALQKIGIESEIFEASARIQAVGAGLGLGVNAMLALNAMGLAEAVAQAGHPLQTFSILDQNGHKISKSHLPSKLGFGNMAIHRADLQQILLSRVNPAAIHLGKKLRHVENSALGTLLYFEDGSTHHSNYLIVADGIHSVLRQQLIPSSPPVYSGYTCWRSVIDSPETNTHESFETWGKNGRFGMVPLSKNRTYWFACVNAKQHDPKYQAFGISDLQALFQHYHAPIPDILKHSASENLLHNDIFDINPIKQFAFGKTVLVGDAAHATSPNMGQGACQAMEDAVVLSNCIAAELDYERAFRRFEMHRLKRTKWVMETSRSIGKMAQTSNPFLIFLRNAVLRMIPDSLGAANLNKLADIDFQLT